MDGVPIRHTSNSFNPTACYIIEPTNYIGKHLDVVTCCVPGTNFELKLDGQHLFSRDT